MTDDLLGQLRAHLLDALELELATIPPYLCALYSISRGTNLEASTVIRSVVMEEMLHMALAANVLNAVGHTDPIQAHGFASPYPKCLPHSSRAFTVSLLPFSDEALRTFLEIERPAPRGAKGQMHHYDTIGQFYEAIEDLLRRACDELGARAVFSGDRARQVTAERWYYGGGGAPVVVTDLESALRALCEITEQGEGTDHTIEDSDHLLFDDVDGIAHYFRFDELRKGRRYRPLDTPASGPTGAEIPIDWRAVAPMRANPCTDDYVAYPAIHRQMVRFDAIYTRLLLTLARAFGGEPAALGDAVPIMYELRYQAEALMRIPSPLEPGRTLGPAFGWHAAPVA